MSWVPEVKTILDKDGDQVWIASIAKYENSEVGSPATHRLYCMGSIVTEFENLVVHCFSQRGAKRIAKRHAEKQNKLDAIKASEWIKA